MEPNQTQGVYAELAGESDTDLLVYMTLADDDPDTARAAWEAFYRRHVACVYAVSLRAYGRLLGGEPGVCDLVSDTFRRAYEHADKFDPADVTDPEPLRRRVRAWLGWIARSLVQTALGGRRRLPTERLDHDRWQHVAQPQPCVHGDPERIARVRAAILALGEREQLVVRVTLQWYRPEQRYQRLPNAVAADLADTLGTTPENLRQIRRRAMAKIRAVLDEHPDVPETGDPRDEP